MLYCRLTSVVLKNAALYNTAIITKVFTTEPTVKTPVITKRVKP